MISKANIEQAEDDEWEMVEGEQKASNRLVEKAETKAQAGVKAGHTNITTTLQARQKPNIDRVEAPHKPSAQVPSFPTGTTAHSKSELNAIKQKVLAEMRAADEAKKRRIGK